MPWKAPSEDLGAESPPSGAPGGHTSLEHSEQGPQCCELSYLVSSLVPLGTLCLSPKKSFPGVVLLAQGRDSGNVWNKSVIACGWTTGLVDRQGLCDGSLSKPGLQEMCAC